MGYWKISLKDPWQHVLDILECGSIALGLEEFNLVINPSRLDGLRIYSDRLVELGGIWTHLADRSRFPKLRRVAIFLNIRGCSPSVTKDNIQLIVSRKQPALAEKDLLYASLYEEFDWRDLLATCEAICSSFVFIINF